MDWRRTLACCAAAGLLAAADQAIAAAIDQLVGFQTTTSGQMEDPAVGPGPLITTATVTIVSASAAELRMHYDTLTRHTDGRTARRVASDVVVPLPLVTIGRSAGSLRFNCRNGSNCISWTHTDFYSDNGAKFGNSGAAPTYAIALGPEAEATLSGSLCQVAPCS